MFDPGTAVRVLQSGEVGVVRDYIVEADRDALYLIQLLNGRHIEVEQFQVRALEALHPSHRVAKQRHSQQLRSER